MVLYWIYWDSEDTDNPGWYQATLQDVHDRRRKRCIFTNKWIKKGNRTVSKNSPDKGDWHDEVEHPLKIVAHPDNAKKTGHYLKESPTTFWKKRGREQVVRVQRKEAAAPAKKPKAEKGKPFPEACQPEYIDYIMFENYGPEAQAETLRIHFPDQAKDVYSCYHVPTLIHSLELRNNDMYNHRTNEFAEWVPSYPGAIIDASGIGGRPGPTKFWKIGYQVPRYIRNDDDVFLRALKGKKWDPKKVYNAILLDDEKIRIGNLAGSFGASKVHGQAPGEYVYALQVLFFNDPLKYFHS
jgi:hypothetical protein